MPRRHCPRCLSTHAIGERCPALPPVATYIRRPHQKLYDSARWKRARQIALNKNPYCATCGEPAQEVDHIIPHRGDLTKFHDLTNLQSLCKACHSKKTAGESRARQLAKMLHRHQARLRNEDTESPDYTPPAP